ncbi:DUF4422 domain-containing protein [Clostridium sp. OS1-26]|uniref:DUF4422 domain-containing protein n=1 Tax=Clostridium sp. OS1-26 TaxID=3070681 RepID=UPI0027E0EF67|nr:DUF4422 domain-containing protein [Clostridium sp. OS1-26]WML36755.1 DUF4422 domain-containing protein [Clostridium sp. OS1-26]
MSKIKIFSTQRRDMNDVAVKNDIFVPIASGACLGNNTQHDGDNTADNISHKNPTFCELTTQYYAWKNVQADYYGFSHYRRYFSFSDELFKTKDWNIVEKDKLDESSINDLKLNDIDKIKSIVESHDIIVPYPEILSNNGFKNVYEQYKSNKFLNCLDLDLMLQIIKDIYPDDFDVAKEYIYGDKAFFCNMFIMKKELFFEYSKWLFDILFEFEKRCDMSNYSQQGLRTPGHISERLFGIYLLKLTKLNKYKIKNVQYVIFKDVSKHEDLLPAFNENAVTIALACSDYYMPYCGTTIYSFLKNANKKYNYDIVLLEHDLKPFSKNLLINMVKQFSDIKVSLRFENVKYYLDYNNINDYQIFGYYCLLIPNIFKNFKRVLYLDSDMIVNDDISELWFEDFENKSIVAAYDLFKIADANGLNKENKFYHTKMAWMKEANLLNQIDSGVLLFNIEKINESKNKDMINYANINKFEVPAKTVMNLLFQEDIKHISFQWNYVPTKFTNFEEEVKCLPYNLFQDYNEASKKPKIIHFSSCDKPWNNVYLEYADKYFQILKETYFYEIVTERRMNDMLNGSIKHKFRVERDDDNFNNLREMLLPYGSRRRNFVKKVYYIIKKR